MIKRQEMSVYRSYKKPLLTTRHLSQRKKFFNFYQKFNFNQWKKVYFSDESRFTLEGPDGNRTFISDKAHKNQPENYQSISKFGGGSLMVWGFITFDGVGKLIKTSNRMNSDEYKSILNNGLISFLAEKNIDPIEIIFQHDNASCHKTKKITEHLHFNQLKTLFWPPNSPDLNPIENIWDYLNKQVRKHKKIFLNENELWEVIQEKWYSIPAEIVSKHFISMTKRLQVLKRNNFETINY